MEDKKNVILAIILTGIILFGWPILAERFFPAPAPATTEAATTKNAAGSTVAPKDDLAVDVPASGSAQSADVATPSAAAKTTIRDRSIVLAETPRIKLQTPKITGSINLKGALVDDVVLTNYREELPKDSPNVHLFSPAGSKDAYYGRFGWAAEGIETPNEETLWAASGTVLSAGSPVTLSWTNATGQLFELALSIDENYMITADQKVTNNGEAAIAVNPYGLIKRVGPSKDTSTWNIHVGPVGVFEDSANYDYDYDDVKELGSAGVDFATTGGWLGFGDTYWLSAIIPNQKTPIEAKFRAGKDNVYQAQMAGKEAKVVAAGASLSQTSRLFAGAKETVLLDQYKDDLGIKLFDRAIDWGWFYWFEKPIFYLLNWLFKMVGNFGVAIIAMTFIVRGVMFPIAQKQFASMAQMRAVQPKMKKVQERYKDDKQKQQQEIMKLYKEEKVNPLAGCAPILLQIPIFFALYKVLMLSIEMRHQPFALWIKDLSAPDPLTPVNLFGLIPFDPPSFLAVGILPILMGITMHLQFKLNPQQMDPVQQQIFGLMPWFLMLVMAPFAAGLQLYWTVSNILTIIQQKWLYSRHPQLKEQMARDAEEKAREQAKKEAEGT